MRKLFSFSIISHACYGTDSWNPSTLKVGTFWTHTIDTMAAGDYDIKGATMVLTYAQHQIG